MILLFPSSETMLHSTMKNLIQTLVCLIFLTGIAIAQSVSGRVDFNVNGVRLGTPYKTVLKKLGKPLKRTIKTYKGSDVCTGDAMTFYSLKYSGVKLMLIRENWKGSPIVLDMRVTSNARWRLRPQIGATRESVKKILGEPDYIYEYGDSVNYSYESSGDLPSITFQFNNGRLIMISQDVLIC
jgi:hypothetical protein